MCSVLFINCYHNCKYDLQFHTIKNDTIGCTDDPSSFTTIVQITHRQSLAESTRVIYQKNIILLRQSFKFSYSLFLEISSLLKKKQNKDKTTKTILYFLLSSCTHIWFRLVSFFGGSFRIVEQLFRKRKSTNCSLIMFSLLNVFQGRRQHRTRCQEDFFGFLNLMISMMSTIFVLSNKLFVLMNQNDEVLNRHE